MSEATSDSCPKREQHGTGFQPPPRAALSRTEDQPGWRRGQSVPFPGPPYSRYRAAALKSKGSCPLPRGPRVLGLMTAGGSCATTSFPAAGSPGWDFLAPILFPLTGWRIQTQFPWFWEGCRDGSVQLPEVHAVLRSFFHSLCRPSTRRNTFCPRTSVIWIIF